MVPYMYGSSVLGRLVTASPDLGESMPEKKVSTTVYITKIQAEKLKELHTRTKVPVAEYIRQGIDMVLKKNSHQLPGQLSLMD